MTENPYAAERPSHLADIWDAAQDRKRAEAESESRYIAWCALIARAIEGGHRVTDVAKAAECSRERVYQILALVEAGKR
jgi:hypothetical protein